jgi:hypothetical protein
MIGSSEINKSIRKIISPTLRENQFSKVRTRNNWRYLEKCIWVFNIRAVGNHFSQVTGYPPMSVVVNLGCYYTFFPSSNFVKVDKDGLLIPAEYLCQSRIQLSNHDINRHSRHSVYNTVNENRDDIWLITPDGENVDIMVQDICDSFNFQGIPWFEKMTDLEIVYSFIKSEADCLIKFEKAMYFSKELGFQSEYEFYKKQYIDENERISRLNR